MNTPGDTITPLPAGVDTQTLAGPVQRALATQQVELIGWHCRSIWQPRVASTRGVYLITTELAEGERQFDAKLVLKVLAVVDAGRLPREAELYASGVLASLGGGLTAPQCFGVTELPGENVAVWLQHVEDGVGVKWSIERFGLAASHLGELAALDTGPGASAAASVPARNLCALHQLCEENLARLEQAQYSPLVQRAYPPPTVAGLRRLWKERAPILEAMARVPYLVCHGDAQRRNLFACRDDRAGERTVAIDWANFATAPVALDIATLVHYALVYFDVDMGKVDGLDRRVFAGYLAGLRIAGWEGDDTIARFAYAAQLALGLGLLEIRPVLRMALDKRQHGWAEGFYGRSLNEILERRAAVAEFLLDLGREAHALAGRVR